MSEQPTKGRGMGSGHDHHAGGFHAGARHRWRLQYLRARGGVLPRRARHAVASGSLALLSDAGHMAADVVAPGGARGHPHRLPTRHHGAAHLRLLPRRGLRLGLAVLLMLGVAVYVVAEALRRLGSPVEVESTAMLVVGALGLAVNVVAILLLRGGAEESLNVRGAYLEVIADAAGSVGVIVAGVLVSRTGEPLWDTLVALAIGIFVAVRAAGFGARSSRSWASTPAGPSRSPHRPTSARIEGVSDVHDLHV